MELFLQLAIIILSTKLAGDLAVRLNQPSVLGKLLVGVLIGPAVLNWVQSSTVIEAFSQIGVLLLMFLAGLETDIGELNENRYSSLAVGVGGILLPLFGGFLFGIMHDMETGNALFLGLLLSATSVSISVQTFKELGYLKSKESTTVLGAALVDDILVVIALAVLMSFLTASDVSIGLVIGKKVLFFTLVGFIGWKLVPFILKKATLLKVTEPILSTALVLCLLFAYLAEYLGIAGIIGSFAAGLALSRTEFKMPILKKVEPLAYSIFIPVFFVSIGLSVRFDGLSNQIFFIVVLSILAIVTKLLGAGLGARLTGFNQYSSLIIGAGMISRGEVALIIASVGLASNLLQTEYYTALIIVVILSTIVTPPLLKLLLTNKRYAVK